jgi:hypothetical protein
MPQAGDPTPNPLDPRVCDLIEAAQRQHYKIGVCATCGGPELYSKTKPVARCLRCRRSRDLGAIAPHAKRHRCLRCRKIFYSVTNWQYCEKCRGKSRVNGEVQVPGLKGSLTHKTPAVLRAQSQPVSRSSDRLLVGVQDEDLSGPAAVRRPGSDRRPQ